MHEQSVPELLENLISIWNQIIEDKNHHLTVNVKDNQIVFSYTCIIIPNLTRNTRPYTLIEML
ncbi:hypothetical protein [Thomasclavelia sp.]|uniref:hypothetical protein n=1 Tax=Thomasclavelia sp. TaxID=3025757 RepID=UPI0039A2D450